MPKASQSVFMLDPATKLRLKAISRASKRSMSNVLTILIHNVRTLQDTEPIHWQARDLPDEIAPIVKSLETRLEVEEEQREAEDAVGDGDHGAESARKYRARSGRSVQQALVGGAT